MYWYASTLIVFFTRKIFLFSLPKALLYLNWCASTTYDTKIFTGPSGSAVLLSHEMKMALQFPLQNWIILDRHIWNKTLWCLTLIAGSVLVTVAPLAVLNYPAGWWGAAQGSVVPLNAWAPWCICSGKLLGGETKPEKVLPNYLILYQMHAIYM